MKSRLLPILLLVTALLAHADSWGAESETLPPTAARAARGLAKVVHLAVRTDVREGSGTADDPRDASTAAKLDALWPSIPS